MAFAMQAQVSGDSTYARHGMRGNWRNHGARDSLHNRYRGNREGYAKGSYESFNRFRSQHRYGNSRRDRFRSSGGKRRGDMAFHMHYSPEQRKQSHAINEDFRKKSKDLFNNDNLTLGGYKSQLLALQKDRKSKLKALLTVQQKESMNRWKKQASENAQVRDAAMLERMRLRLQLSEAQTASIKNQRSGFRTQIQAIHENEDLLPYQKMEQIRAMKDKEKESIKSVLTPEQYSQLKNMQHYRLGGK